MALNYNHNLIIIAGATAVGKSSFAIELAKKVGGEVISADSMQIYRGMDIGSGKVKQEERMGIPHHMIDIVDPKEGYTVAKYQKAARKIIAELQSQGKMPLVCGGTGLYISSILFDLDFGKKEYSSTIRESLEKELLEKGSHTLYERLSSLAPESASRIHPNNGKKIIRALESYLLGEEIKDFSRDMSYHKGYEPLIIVLDRDRQELYSRINTRTKEMFDQGLVEEVRSLRNKGLTADDMAMKGIGYKEVFEFLSGDIGYEDMISLVQKNSRRYSKRQRTWFKRYADAHWISLSLNSEEDALEIVLNLI